MPVPPRWRRRLRSHWRRWPVLRWSLTATAVVLLVAPWWSRAGRDPAPRRQVPVLTADVAAGEIVADGDVRLAWRDASSVPSAALSGAWAGRTAVVPLVAGEVLIGSRLAPEGLSGVAALLGDDERAMALPPGPGGRPPLSVGDRVDLLATVTDDSGAIPSFVVSAGARVVDVDDESDVVTVAVPASDATAVAAVIATGTITLALSPPG